MIGEGESRRFGSGAEDYGESHKEAEVRTKEEFLEQGVDHLFRKPFGREWSSHDWTKWAVIQEVVHRLAVPAGSRILDVGCGPGWIALFLAESGFRTTGIDIAPAFIDSARERAKRWDVPARFEVRDMDAFSFDAEFDGVVVFDALHHSNRQPDVVRNIARSLRPGGWVLFGEPSWLHKISPAARRVHRERGWIERGITVRSLKRDCRATGLGQFRRFFEGTRPYERRVTEAGWQLVRLVAADVAVAPQASVWLLATKL